MSDKDIDFIETSKKIVVVLRTRVEGMNLYDQIRYVYNQAIDDAINFVDDMAKSNPQHRMAYTALAKELRHWMTLREPE